MIKKDLPLEFSEPEPGAGYERKCPPTEKGLVVSFSKNLFRVRVFSANREIECRIKGKVLKAAEGFYNPLAPGDIVEIDNGLIVGLEERRNIFARYNQKGSSPQILASNVDLIICVTSPVSPPFRPRFLDRLLLQAEIADIPAIIACNKYDLEYNDSMEDTEERLSDYERIGIPVFRLSARTGEGMPEFGDFIKGKFSVLTGQSGVGKSSLVNALIPGKEIKTGAINEKYDRGNHITTRSFLLDIPDGSSLDNKPITRIIDTPGIRRFVPFGLNAEDLIHYMREFAPLAGKCSYGLSCWHETEPGCKILEAVDAGVIHEDRWTSFLKIREELSGKRKYEDND